MGAGTEPILYKLKVPRKEREADYVEPAHDLETLQRYAVWEELFHLIHQLHVENNHCRLDKLYALLKVNYSNIGEKVVKHFLKDCTMCNTSLPRVTIHAGHKPILTKGFNLRAQIDLIDY